MNRVNMGEFKSSKLNKTIVTIIDNSMARCAASCFQATRERTEPKKLCLRARPSAASASPPTSSPSSPRGTSARPSTRSSGQSRTPFSTQEASEAKPPMAASLRWQTHTILGLPRTVHPSSTGENLDFITNDRTLAFCKYNIKPTTGCYSDGWTH